MDRNLCLQTSEQGDRGPPPFGSSDDQHSSRDRESHKSQNTQSGATTASGIRGRCAGGVSVLSKAVRFTICRPARTHSHKIGYLVFQPGGIGFSGAPPIPDMSSRARIFFVAIEGGCPIRTRVGPQHSGFHKIANQSDRGPQASPVGDDDRKEDRQATTSRLPFSYPLLPTSG